VVTLLGTAWQAREAGDEAHNRPRPVVLVVATLCTSSLQLMYERPCGAAQAALVEHARLTQVFIHQQVDTVVLLMLLIATRAAQTKG